MTDVQPRHGLPTQQDPAIMCRGLTKDYGGGRGLFDLDLEVGRGEILGFIGPNGAGKTTTIRLLMDLIRPTRGSATVLGLDAHRDSLAIKRRVGYLPGELAEFSGARVRHVLALLAGLRGGVDPARITSLADRLQLEMGRKYADLSHGNKQKVGLVQAFMHRPELLILDEPTLGLDPLVQREFWLLVREAAADGASVLLSSHVLAEVENGCDRIALIRSGRLVRAGSLTELRDLRTHRVDAVLKGPVPIGEIAVLPGVSDAEVTGERLSCSVQGPVGPLVDWLASHDVVELDSRELTLEEVFLHEFDSAS